MDQATEAAFLAQLERKRTDMHDHMRQRRLRKAGKPPPMQQMLAAASQPPADVLTLEPSFGAAEEASEREMEEQEVEWARQKCAHARAYWATKEARALKVLAGDPSGLSSQSSLFNLRRVDDGFGRLSPDRPSANASLPTTAQTEVRLSPPVGAPQSIIQRRIRKGTGRRAGLVLSCDGWGLPSESLP